MLQSFYKRQPQGLKASMLDVGLQFSGREHSGQYYNHWLFVRERHIPKYFYFKRNKFAHVCAVTHRTLVINHFSLQFGPTLLD